MLCRSRRLLLAQPPLLTKSDDDAENHCTHRKHDVLYKYTGAGDYSYMPFILSRCTVSTVSERVESAAVR